MTDIEDRLEVRVVGADELPDAEGGECNPYVIIRCGLIKSEQTGVVHNSKSPSWAHEERMVFTDLTENGVSHIVATVYHKSQGAVGEDLALGKAVIDLTTNLMAPGIEIDENYNLDSGGSLRLEMVYFMGDGGDLFDLDDDDDDEISEERRPNMIVGVVVRARGLVGLVDAYVSTKIENTSHKAKTNLVRNSNAPVFSGNEFRLPCEDGNAKLIIKVKQRMTLRNQVLGIATIALVEVAAYGDTGLTKWCPLLGTDGAIDGDARGEVQIMLRWIYDRKYARSLARILRTSTMLSSASKRGKGEIVTVKEQTCDDSSFLGGTQKNDKKSIKSDMSQAAALYLAEEEALVASQQELSIKEKEEAEERRANTEMMADRVYEERIRGVTMPSGDYQIQVQIVEARDLKAEDAGGTSDPYVRVRCLGKIKKSRVIRKVTSCYFGETLYFNFSNLTSAEIERATIDVDVMDYDFFSAHDMIGSVSFDAKKIHSMENHEFYRKWVGLIDATNDQDTGYQGYLKISVTVLGPDDEQRVHDPDREYQAELDQAEKSQDGITIDESALASTVPISKLKFLVVYLFAATDIPQTGISGVLFSSASGAETRVEASFGGVRIASSIVRVRSSNNTASLAPEFKEELWIPVSEPTEASVVRLALLDARRNQLVASVALDYNTHVDHRKDSSTYPRPKWYHLYGADAACVRSKTRFGSAAEAQNRYGFEQGSTYRGRLLAKCCVVDAKEAKNVSIFSSSTKSSPFIRAMTTTSVDLHSTSYIPASAAYTLKVLLVAGSELPVVRARGSVKASEMRLVVSIGRRCTENSIEFSWRPVTRGVATWNELLWIPSIELPVVIDDIPDICLHLEAKHPSKGKGRLVCFARIPAARLLRKQFDTAEPIWESLRREPGTGITAPGINPGAVLTQIAFALRQDALELNWPPDAKVLNKAQKTAPYCVRVYVYQAKNLPSSDEDGMLDAYVKVRFRGEKLKTKVASKTTAPLFYETLQFQSHELPIDKRYGPDILLQVWDQDTLGTNSLVATLRLALPECPILLNEASAPPTPSWRRLYDINGILLDDAQLLVSAALIKKRELHDKIDRPQSIIPVFRMAFLEITCVGVRQLRGFTLLPPRRPQLRGDICAPNDGDTYFKTKPAITDTGAALAAQAVITDEDDEATEDAQLLGKKKKSAAVYRSEQAKLEKGGRNANFCERKVLAIEMPENPLYAQHLDLRVYDAGRTGRPLLGACAVDLGPKMPWNREYIPPQMELYDDAERRRQKEKADEERKKRQQEQQNKTESDDDSFNDSDHEGALSKRIKNAKVRFADDNEASSDDDDEENMQDEMEPNIQHELEWRTTPPRHRSGDDDGVGAFNPMHVDDLPMIIEDQLYIQAEEERLKAESQAEIEQNGETEHKKRGIDSRSYFQRTLASFGLGGELETILGGETTYKLSELGLEFPSQWAAAEYLHGRDWWLQQGGSELEHLLRTKPFENYTLIRGKYSADPRKRSLKPVGILKAIIRITDEDPSGDWFVPRDALRPQLYCIRLYCIKATNLQPVDADSVDPYLRVKLGSSNIDARPSTHKDRSCDPNLYQVFEFLTTIPGPSVLKIQIKDWNRFNPYHALVGETKIDLEDRWFHPEWQKLDATRQGEINKLKPIEVRSLRKETSSVTQGQLYMWLEIRPDWEARRDPKVELEGPEKKKFEVRVICWKSIEVPREMGDYYCQFWIGDSRKQKTDIHWRCRYGKASWNWRIKIPVTLPLDSPEKGRLAIQLWDQDILKWNDVIGENEIDLYKFFLKAYHEKRTVNVFKLINDAREKKLAEEQGLITEEDLEEEDDDSGSDDDDEDNDENEDNDADEDEDDGGDRKEDPNQDLETGEEPLLGEEDTEAADDGDEENKDKTKKKKKKKKTSLLLSFND
mmetsp:Transcript_20321/g.31021  ORF Transcript_20321/g.31021 Transcript_20321/m.31021 type:complete len:1900 (+) Transcript_20321:164-5863(+)